MSEFPLLKPITQVMLHGGLLVLMLGIGIFITGMWLDSLILKLIASISLIGIVMILYGFIRIRKIPLGENEHN